MTQRDRRNYLTWHDQSLTVLSVWRYLHEQQRRPQQVEVASLLTQEALHHWSNQVLVLPTGEYYYRGLTVAQLLQLYRELDQADLSMPIFIVGQEVLDGMHRLLAAALRGEATISAYLLTPYDMQQLLQQNQTY